MLGTGVSGAKALGGSLLVAYFSAGWLAGYLYTRNQLTREMSDIGRKLKEVEKERTKRVEAEEKAQVAEKKANEVVSTVSSVVAKGLNQGKSDDVEPINGGVKGLDGFAYMLNNIKSEVNLPDNYRELMFAASSDPVSGLVANRGIDENWITSAEVFELVSGSDWFKVVISLKPANSSVRPENKKAYLLLHHSFPNPVHEFELQTSEMKFELVAWGAFTYAFFFENGKAVWLDLSKLASAPARFLSR